MNREYRQGPAEPLEDVKPEPPVCERCGADLDSKGECMDHCGPPRVKRMDGDE